LVKCLSQSWERAQREQAVEKPSNSDFYRRKQKEIEQKVVKEAKSGVAGSRWEQRDLTQKLDINGEPQISPIPNLRFQIRTGQALLALT
jgi:hypothetical protein